MAELRESIGREALLALSNQYGSVADALMEIVDNPFDYRRGRQLTIELAIDKKRDMVRIVDHGGQGMGRAELADWIRWGTGHTHAATDIGQWHVGGKLAAMYLAESIEIIGRKSDTTEIVRFTDREWGSRTHLFSGDLQTMSPHDLPNWIPAEITEDPTRGFTSITLRRLKDHRYELGILELRLGNTYRALLRAGACVIRLNGVPIQPLDIPRSGSYSDREIRITRTKLEEGVTVQGEIWITDRERFRPGRGVNLEAGIRTVFNGRLITSGEEFGHYLAGRGSLQRLVGEIELQHIRPNTTKDGWDRDSPQWQAVHRFMHAQMAPLVAFLNQLAEARPISREQKKRAAAVRKSVEETLRRLRDSYHLPGGQLDDEIIGPGGRARPQHQHEGPPTTQRTRTRAEATERTEPPEDAVGRLLRRLHGGVPPIDFDDLGRTARTQTRPTENGPYIIVNTAFPLYERFGETEEYLAESVFLHLLREDEESSLSANEAAQHLDDMLFTWREVVA